MLSETRLHEETNRNHEDLPPDYVDRRSGDPEPFADDDRILAELERIEAENTPDLGFVRVSPSKKKDRDTRTIDQCPRAFRRVIDDGSSALAIWLPCKARTCEYCRPAIDERDAARLVASLADAETFYRATIPVASWGRVYKRAQRKGAVAVKMQSAASHDHIEVVSSEPVTVDARPVSTGEVVDLVEHRPPWAPGRARMSGPGLISVADWEERTNPTKPEARAVTMHHSVTADDVEVAAEVLKIPTAREGPYQIRLLAPWTDPRMVALRAWVQDPNGSLEWSRMLWEAEVAQGARPIEDPPLDAYTEAA